MTDTSTPSASSAEFEAAVAAIRAGAPREEVVITEIPAPKGLAPSGFALAADVRPTSHGIDSVLGTGRFVLLHDPDEPEAWGGPFRVICYAQAPLETDIGLDPFVADVAWAWLTDALDARGAAYASASGTATKNISTGYGELADQGDGAELELRASWSPLDDRIGSHVEAWAELLCMLAGLPPTLDGVTMLRTTRAARD
ncbi:DUF3000 domain-containing protein [Schumannella sp. 10F1B-5-1]|uniref:DUF3000 domain-containing protein n=1 Tax=Schumannella sp. 10F1B-5-1 TaxID=2590780 RepID=UPI0011303395|nr:DUF3000 domain-containing protein [Schumannella sp. 10F1B-5-1]TPW70886.1 DUF3000 domain-containing protein [Schumannella sp. 10F1B-5-1]